MPTSTFSTTGARGLIAKLQAKAVALGFDAIAIAPAKLPAEVGERLKAFIELDHHGTMNWMPGTVERRISPDAMWPQAKSAVVLAMAYGPEFDPLSRLTRRETGVISVYALNRDYHDIIKGKLKTLAQWLVSRNGEEVKVFVDTAPLMEKPLAAMAGLGWQGKHTNLVSRELGSWFFLGVILTTAQLDTGEPDVDHCGSCRACLDICPTNAFPAPYQLDARRCISYLTIEHKEHIDRDLRDLIGNRIFGCDDCLAVCPWNKFAGTARETKLKARDDLIAPSLEELGKLDDAAFRKLFSGSPVKRVGRDRFVRNVLIAIGNSGMAHLTQVAEARLEDGSALVRAMAVWALSRLLGSNEFDGLRQRHAHLEVDEFVRREWREATS